MPTSASLEPESSRVTREQWHALSDAAWQARGYARVLGDTKVGASVLTDSGAIYGGCNVEHRFRSHDVHAEVNALTSMVTAGHQKVVAVLIASNRELFTPCGGCMDWIFELGGAETIVAVENEPGVILHTYYAQQLMPHYPR